MKTIRQIKSEGYYIGTNLQYRILFLDNNSGSPIVNLDFDEYFHLLPKNVRVGNRKATKRDYNKLLQKAYNENIH